MAPLWLLLQLGDSAFPAGGFAHSGGLEAASAQGELRGPGALRRFARDALFQAGHGALPLVTAAHAEPAALVALDARAEAFLVGHVQNRASRTQGRAFLDTAARVFPAEVGPLQAAARAGGVRFHHAPLFGATLRALGVARAEAQALFLSGGLRATLSAAVRLGLAGIHEAQALQHELAGTLDAVLAACAELDPAALAQTAPIAELLGATHDRLYSRLFQS